MNLDYHLAVGVELLAKANHRHLHQVGLRSLNREVDCLPFGRLNGQAIGAPQIRCWPTAAKQSLNVALLAGGTDCLLEVVAQARTLEEVVIDELLGFAVAEISLLGQAVGSLAVENTKIDDFGQRPLLGFNLVRINVEDLAGCQTVDILAGGKSFNSCFSPAKTAASRNSNCCSRH